jgi:hypothetical protein
MKKFIRQFENDESENINISLIKRNGEEPLITFIVDIFKSLEITNYITLLDYKVLPDESRIDFNKYITTRKKVKKKDMNVRYQYIHPDRCVELILTFKIHVKGEEAIVQKNILVPKLDENNYFIIRGKRYFLLYQLVDNSTYTSRNGLTLKSLMPICINKEMDKLVDVEGNSYDIPYYYINAFQREIETFLFYFCKSGFRDTMKYFSIDKLIVLVPFKEEQNSDQYYFFTINNNMTLGVNRYFFDKYLYVQSMALMIKRCMNNRTTIENLEDQKYWMERLGSLYTTTSYTMYESGKSTVAFFERLLDITTQKKLKISDINKVSVYSVIKWMVQNYIDLKKKDNLDLDNKRLRLNEYVAALLSKRMGESINRLLTLGNKIKIKQVRDIFKFPGTLIFQLLYNSPLLKYNDAVNDLDAMTALRYSVRGPNSLGNRSDRNISIKYRSCHPSYIARLDLNSCSSSSPGLSGVVSCFAKTDNLWFNSKKESEDTEYEIVKATDEYFKPEGLRIELDKSSPEAYYNAKLKLRESLNDCSLVLPLEDKDDQSNYYPDNPNGDLKIGFGVKEESFMKPIIL